MVSENYRSHLRLLFLSPSRLLPHSMEESNANNSPLLSLRDERHCTGHEDAQQEPPSDHHPPPPVASLSLSLSLSTFSPSFQISSSASSSSKPSLSSIQSHLKIPSQASSISLSLSLSAAPSAKHSSSSSSASKISSSLLASPFPILRRRSSDPSHGAAARRCTVVWFRSDLRLHDNEALSAASAQSLSLLPVYFFDPRDYGKSCSGFDRTGPCRARFLIDSVADLRAALRARGSDLVVRVGRPEVLLPEIVRAVGADAVHAHREVSKDEVRTEDRVAEVMEAEGVEVKYFWGSTLYHIEDLPFGLEQMPSNYGGFREKLKGVAARKVIETPEDVKGLPSRGNIELGEIPSLQDLGLKPAPALSQDISPDGKSIMSSSLVGGETEALNRLKKFAAECLAQPNMGSNDSTKDSIYGANFSCKISPWLATGCLSPRFMYEELKKTATRTFSAASQKNNASGEDGNGMNWLMFELMWRDFFRFITKKYSSTKKDNFVPATASAGALA